MIGPVKCRWKCDWIPGFSQSLINLNQSEKWPKSFPFTHRRCREFSSKLYWLWRWHWPKLQKPQNSWSEPCHTNRWGFRQEMLGQDISISPPHSTYSVYLVKSPFFTNFAPIDRYWSPEILPLVWVLLELLIPGYCSGCKQCAKRERVQNNKKGANLCW